MNLPSTFKFTHQEDDTVYYATVIDKKVMIDWNDNDGKPQEWSKSLVEGFIKYGTWIIADSDKVNHPSHYQGKTEVIDIIEQATTDLNGFQAYCLGNVIKYVMRHQKKGGIEDLKKASWYLNKVIGGENE